MRHRPATAGHWTLVRMRARDCRAPDGRVVRNDYHQAPDDALEEESAMRDCDRLQGLERRTFLGGATLAGVASMLGPRAALAQPSAAVTPTAAKAGITMLTAEHTVGSAVNHAYAVKAGPFVFLNGHEAYDFAAGVTPAV